ncbi:MAG: hypothetical protein JKY66_09550 [Spongiibacteraceae bacterium]|nr:hypothetical protein [Spongiibacteraceae bacterium]
MTAYQLIDITSNIGNRIDVQWILFVTVHMALFGGIIYVDRPLRLLEKIATCFIYTGFACLNYIVISRQMFFSEQVYTEITKLSHDVCCANNAIITHMAQEQVLGKFSHSIFFLALIHVLMFIVVFFAIIYDRALNEIKTNQTQKIPPCND